MYIYDILYIYICRLFRGTTTMVYFTGLQVRFAAEWALVERHGGGHFSCHGPKVYQSWAGNPGTPREPGKTIGKPWENGGLMGFNCDLMVMYGDL